MNTPTPEDIALAERLDELTTVGGMGMACLPIDRASRVIADHCAPLRERIKELESLHLVNEPCEQTEPPAGWNTEENTGPTPPKPTQGYVMQCDGEDMRIATEGKEVWRGSPKELASLRQLAEIGRLAVEHRRARQAYHGRIKMRTEAEEETLWNDWTRKELKLVDACDAYLAKEGK